MNQPVIYDSPADLPIGLLAGCRTMPFPHTLLMCPPAHFAVVDVKNPHMAAHVGAVDTGRAAQQWERLRAAFERAGVRVEQITPVDGCEDMVFCANQTFVGPAEGGLLCLRSNMRHESRQREVPAFEAWFARRGYRVAALPASVGFEGSGDAIWHPGRGLIWGGHGYRTRPEAYEHVASRFGVPVIRLKLVSEHFYHLDTCFCAIDERTVLIHPAGLTAEGAALVRSVFADVIECSDEEALRGMACNACAVSGRAVVIQSGNPRTAAALRERGFEVIEIDTSEFIKSGGSVFCMKMYVF